MGTLFFNKTARCFIKIAAKQKILTGLMCSGRLCCGLSIIVQHDITDVYKETVKKSCENV